MAKAEIVLSPLQRCPMCSYSLEGLPDHHNCPECGFEYDKRMQVVQQGPALAIIAVLVIVIICAALLFIRGSLLFRIQFWLTAPIGIIWASWYAGCYITGRRNKIIVYEAGITIIKGRQVAKVLPSDQIETVGIEQGRIAIVQKRFRLVYPISDMFLGSSTRMEHLNRLIQHFFTPENGERQPTGIT